MFGAHILLPPASDTNVIAISTDDVLIHPLWIRPMMVHDIALVRFSDPVPINGISLLKVSSQLTVFLDQF